MSQLTDLDITALAPLIARREVSPVEVTEAQLARIGWYREVRVKSEASQWLRSLLVARERLVRVRRDLSNQIRSFLRHYGLRLGTVTSRRFAARVRGLAAGVPALQELVAGLLAVREAASTELAVLDRRVNELAREYAGC